MCQNGGTCSQHIFEYMCKCTSAYSGTFCEISEWTTIMLYTLHAGLHYFSSDTLHFLTHPFNYNCAALPLNTDAVLGGVLGTALLLTAVAILLFALPCLVHNWKANK